MEEAAKAVEPEKVEDASPQPLKVAGSNPEIVPDHTTDDLKIILGRV